MESLVGQLFPGANLNSFDIPEFDIDQPIACIERTTPENYFATKYIFPLTFRILQSILYTLWQM